MKAWNLAVSALIVGSPLVASADAPMAADKKPFITEAPKPSPEMEKLKNFMASGNWKCTGTASMPGGATRTITAKAPIKTDLNGMWQTVRYEEAKTKENPMPFQAVEYFTYDTANKLFVRTVMDSMGNMVNMTAPSMEGEKMTFQGESNMNGNKTPIRMTYEKRGKEMAIAMEASAEGNWTKTMEVMCKK